MPYDEQTSHERLLHEAATFLKIALHCRELRGKLTLLVESALKIGELRNLLHENEVTLGCSGSSSGVEVVLTNLYTKLWTAVSDVSSLYREQSANDQS